MEAAKEQEKILIVMFSSLNMKGVSNSGTTEELKALLTNMHMQINNNILLFSFSKEEELAREIVWIWTTMFGENPQKGEKAELAAKEAAYGG